MFPQFDALVNYRIISYVVPEINDRTILDVISLRKTCKGSREIVYRLPINKNAILQCIRHCTKHSDIYFNDFLNSEVDPKLKFQTIVRYFYYTWAVNCNKKHKRDWLMWDKHFRDYEMLIYYEELIETSRNDIIMYEEELALKKRRLGINK